MGGKNSNRYSICENVVFIFTKYNQTIIIDKEDFERVKKHCWRTDKDGYFRATIKNKNVRLHRFILNKLDFSDKLFVDHKNGMIWDNRKCNLRLCTPKQNCYNVSRYRKDKPEEMLGIHYDKRHNIYIVMIGEIENGKKSSYKGSFKTLEEAKECRDKWFYYYKEKYINSIS